MITVPTKHVILYPHSLGPVPAPMQALLEHCDLWWLNRGLDLAFAACEVRAGHAINLEQENPWPPAAGWWMEQHDYDPTVSLVLFLAGWNHGYWIGWGGRLGTGTGGLSVVGDYALDRIRSVPTTPDDATDAADGLALVDDREVGQLLLHEQGHALGLPHDFETPGAVMGYQWGTGFNAILGDKTAAQLEALWAPAAQGASEMVIQGCRRPDVAP